MARELRHASCASAPPSFGSGCGFELFFSTATSTASSTPVAHVDEFYRLACDALEIAVPAAFIPPKKSGLRLVLRDEARVTATRRGQAPGTLPTADD